MGTKFMMLKLLTKSGILDEMDDFLGKYVHIKNIFSCRKYKLLEFMFKR